MNNESVINIRTAGINDLDFITALISRLTEFGPPEWRNETHMQRTDMKLLANEILNGDPSTIFIAESDNLQRLGFIHVQPGSDHYNKEPHGHISDLVISTDAEGRGVGRQLMRRAEEWARGRGYQWLTLSVFAQNARAIALYEKIGFGADIVKYVKELK